MDVSFSALLIPRMRYKLYRYISELEKGKMVEYELGKGRQAYLINMEGKLKINDELLVTREASKLIGPVKLKMEGVGDEMKSKETIEESEDVRGIGIVPSAHFMMVEMKKA